MCGIAGFWSAPDMLDSGQRAGAMERMAHAIRHRGPDEEGYWQDDTAGLGLAHRRLSILDLTPAGSQPMQSGDGRYVIVYNGEIYNHLDLRSQLAEQGHDPGWKGHSDTETLLAAIEQWGLDRTLQAACGMFAFALWDRHDKALYLARDRAGEKPLFYGSAAGGFVFGSELRSVSALPGFDNAIDPDAAALFLRYSYVPAPLSIFCDISKLMPGHYARITSPDEPPRIVSYWSLPQVAEQAAAERAAPRSLAENGKRLESVLSDVISSQLISDVPVGAFLSGGIDSSLITALMQKNSASPVSTYSIGFEDPHFNEAQHAASVADHLGTDHTPLILTERNILDLVPSIPDIYDEPFADPSLLPTTLLCAMTRENVTVALSGDGGDEMFAGYNRHTHGPRLWSAMRRTPQWGRNMIGTFTAGLERLFVSSPASATSLARKLNLPLTVPDKLARFGIAASDAVDFTTLYELLLATGVQFQNPFSAQLIERLRQASQSANLESAEQFMLWDTLSYLPDDILVKVDRAAMAASLETRTPFLDRRVMEAAWSIPLKHKLGVHGSKTILREILYRHVPKEIIDRPKQGFAIPLNSWLRGALRDWGSAGVARYGTLAELRPFQDDVDQAWQEHQSGKRQHGNLLLNAVILSDWLQAHKTKSGGRM